MGLTSLPLFPSFTVTNRKEVDQYRTRHEKVVRADRTLRHVSSLVDADSANEKLGGRQPGRSEHSSNQTVADRVVIKRLSGIHVKIPEEKFRKNLAFLEKHRLANFRH